LSTRAIADEVSDKFPTSEKRKCGGAKHLRKAASRSKPHTILCNIPMPKGVFISVKAVNVRTTWMQLVAIAVRAAFLTAGPTRETQIQLAASCSGRLLLHLICACHDHKLRWHWRCMLREFARA
jgi:hypothetical protein